jgi:hypothetical protein
MSFKLDLISIQVEIALNAGDALLSSCTKLQTLLKGADRKTVHGIVCPMVAAHYGETFANGKWANSDCAAKRKANRIIGAIVGTTPSQSTKAAVNKKALAAMVDAVVANGLTSKEMNAVIAALRAAISFE